MSTPVGDNLRYQYVNLKTQSREMELADAQRKLELTNSTLSITVGSRDARIRELESMLHAKEKEVKYHFVGITKDWNEELRIQDRYTFESCSKMCTCFVQMQATHKQLQSVELAIDANENLARKLEFDLKVMSNMLWQVLPPSQLSIHLCTNLILLQRFLASGS